MIVSVKKVEMHLGTDIIKTLKTLKMRHHEQILILVNV